MQEILDSVRRSFAFPPPAGDESGAGTLVDKLNSRIRRSRVFSKPLKSSSPPVAASSNISLPSIRWRKGDLIGCGAFGRVYMGMNLDSGELLAVKEVSIASNHASREKAQAHIKELEEEVNLLKNLSHPNIVRYLGTVREEDSLNILLEFVPGGSISSLLGEFGPFPESVIKSYTKQLLLGLEYLHKSDIMHRDIKGANILVDNTGCIKLADFGASKKVVALATISGAKSMKGTPYWMAPEVILQTGHSFSADIWSVGCTIIEMATGKPPWSEQYQEVAALFHIGTTKSHPPIPEHLSAEAKDFLLKCLQKEPKLRPISSELLQHPFVTGVRSTPVLEYDGPAADLPEVLLTSQKNLEILQSCSSADVFDGSELKEETRYSDDEMCLIDDKEMFSLKLETATVADADLNQSFNPMSEPSDVWRCSIGQSHELEQIKGNMDSPSIDEHARISLAFGRDDNDSSSPYCPSSSEEDDDLTKSKIKAFLDEKVIELKKLQTPLYEEFLNTLNGCSSPSLLEGMHNDSSAKFLKLPPRSRSPGQLPSGSPSAVVDCGDTASPTSYSRCLSNISNTSNQTSPDVTPPQCKEQRGLHVDGQQDSNSPSMSFSERQKRWKEELDQELARQREIMRQSGVVGKASSPIDRALHRQKERSRFASPTR